MPDIAGHSKSAGKSKSSGSSRPYEMIGKTTIYLVVFVVILIIIYTFSADFLSTLSWLYGVDPTMILLLIGLVSLFLTFMFLNITRLRGRK